MYTAQNQLGQHCQNSQNDGPPPAPMASARRPVVGMGRLISARHGFPARAGFTLIEVLVVMAIVAMLLTIALPRYFGSVEKSKEVALKENLQVMRTGLDKYYSDKGHYPNALSDLVSDKYFRSVPVDPVTELSTTWILVPSQETDKPGVADVRSGAKGKTHDGIPFGQL